MQHMTMASSSSRGSTGGGQQNAAPESLYIFCGQPIVKTMKFHVLAAGTVIFGLVSVRKSFNHIHTYYSF